MNNAKSILLVSIITATLILGTSVIPMQTYGSENKNTKDSKSSIKASAELDKKSAGQNLDQDNFCYRGDDCEQANQGQQVEGRDNAADGFNDQSRNIQSTPATTGAAGGAGNSTRNTGNGTTPTAPTGTLNVCKEVSSPFDVNPSDFTFTFTSGGASPSEFPGSADCTKVTVPEGPYSFMESGPQFLIFTDVVGDCTQDAPGAKAFHGSIKAGETQTCTVRNLVT